MTDSIVHRMRPLLARLLPLLIVVGAWAAVGSLDWVMRFRWFQWQRSFVLSGLKPRYFGDWTPLATNHVAAGRGGDLSRLIGIPAAAAPFEVERPDDYAVVTDEYGFPNVPPTTNRWYPIAVVGDSYMLQGRGMTNLMASRIARITGQEAYTVAHAGRGAVFALSGFLDHPIFRAHPARVVVWGIAERDTTGMFFDSMLTQVMTRYYKPDFIANAAESGPRILWSELLPDRIKRSLPNTSFAAQMLRRIWNQVRYVIFRRITPEVLPSSGAFHGQPLLFYREAVKAMQWSAQVREVPRMLYGGRVAQENFFGPRGLAWIIVLIPDKEQVYRDLLPPEARAGGEPPPSCLDEVAEGLRKEGVHVVNLLPAFREAAARGELLYWPDDTHWNDAGMELAARLIGAEILALPPDGVH